MERKNILFVTGTRADFGKLEQLANVAVKIGHKVTFFVTGMHMHIKYGLTKEEVRSRSQYDYFEFMNDCEGEGQDLVIANTIKGFSDFVSQNPPDLVIIHGDRAEALACCIVCSTKYIRCAHIEGGELSGTIDEVFRHCNTKLSHIHLVSSEVAKNRVIRLGEDCKSIWSIGSPELDAHSKNLGLDLSSVIDRYGIKDRDYGICIFHSVTSEVDRTKEYVKTLFDALQESKKYFVVIAPNNDPGSEHIFEKINTLSLQKFCVLPSMRFNHFSVLLRNSKLVIGNSSVGVREAPFLGIPSINIGTRQHNRNTYESIVNCTSNSIKEIAFKINNIWGTVFAPSADFGKGNASQKFSEVISSEEFWSRPLQKYFVE